MIEFSDFIEDLKLLDIQQEDVQYTCSKETIQTLPPELIGF